MGLEDWDTARSIFARAVSCMRMPRWRCWSLWSVWDCWNLSGDEVGGDDDDDVVDW